MHAMRLSKSGAPILLLWQNVFFEGKHNAKSCFQYCPREANEVAHQLAKSAYSSKYFEKKELTSLNKFVYFSFLILAINIFTTMI
jgi:hypothetical protein